MSVVNHEIEARDGSIKTMGSWKEWSGLTGELADAANQGTQAREEAKANDIAADLQVIRENKNLSNDGKAQLMAIYKEKYDGYVPTELADALRGHLDDDVAEDMIEKSLRYNGGVYDYEMENVSTEIFNKYKDKIIASGALNAGTEDYKKAQNLLKAYTNAGTGDTFGETDTKSEAWLTLYGNLEEIFNSTYKETYMQNGVVVSTPKDAFRAAQAAVKEVLTDDRAVKRLMVPELDPLDDSYSRRIQLNLEQASGGNWRKVKLATDVKSEQELIAWSQTPLKQSSDIPEYYRDLAMRMGVNPIDLANQQLKFYTEEEVKEDKKEQKFDDKVLELIYKFPTRSSITRARLEVEGAGEQNVKTSIYNKKALMRKDK
jgi:hypothetical protein